MKKLTLLFVILTAYTVSAQNVGIGTINPLARLHITDSSVLFSATGGLPVVQGNPPVSGVGRRMMWYPDKAAFRAGYVSGTYWNKDSIGSFSFAAGYDTRASGIYSTAMGYGTTASADYSTAMGQGTTVSGFSSTAMGQSTTASGYSSTAMGYITSASGNYSTAMGFRTIASGNYSTAMGRSTTASREYSTAMGYATSASGDYSTAMGFITIASGFISTALGESTIASGFSTTAMGQSTTASGFSSTAMGQGTRASGYSSSAMGLQTIAKGYSSTVLGLYNDSILTTNETSVSSTTPLLIVGNGDNTTARSNALVVLKNGNTGIGINTPESPLSFASVLGEKISLWGSSSNNYGFGVVSSLLQIHTADNVSDVAFGYGSSASFTETMRIKANGNVGIGITNPTASLEVMRGTGGGGTAVFHGTSHISHFNFGTNEDTYIRAGKDNRYVIINDIPGGKVGIGIAAPTEKLDVNGNIKCVSLIQTSDSRLKKGITPLQNSLQKITQLNGYTYHWKNEQTDDRLQTGVLAQEVQKIFPQLVTEDNKGMLSVNYSGLIPVLIESIKEQQKQIDELRKLVDKLTKQ